MKLSPDAALETRIEHYRHVSRAYVDAVNRGDLDAILACYAEDAEIHDPVGRRYLKGKAALREFYASVIGRAHMEIVGPIRGSFGTSVATPLRSRIPGKAIDCITVSRFDDDGLIVEYSAYWGPTDMHDAED